MWDITNTSHADITSSLWGQTDKYPIWGQTNPQLDLIMEFFFVLFCFLFLFLFFYFLFLSLSILTPCEVHYIQLFLKKNYLFIYSIRDNIFRLKLLRFLDQVSLLQKKLFFMMALINMRMTHFKI